MKGIELVASENLAGEAGRENTDREVASAEKEVDGDAAVRGAAGSFQKNLLSGSVSISSSLKCAALPLSKEGESFSETFQRVWVLTGEDSGG